MMLTGLLVAFACACLGAALVVRAARELWRTSGWALLRTRWRARALEGVAEAVGPVVSGPFSGRPALWVRARVVGPPPEGGPARVLWSKELTADTRIRTDRAEAHVDWQRTVVLVEKQYRRGALKVLEREAPALTRVLARAGYRERPKGMVFFELEEELLEPSSRVLARATLTEGASKTVEPVDGETRVVLSSLGLPRLVLRQSWGPLLALWFAALAVASGGGVLLAAWWLRRGG